MNSYTRRKDTIIRESGVDTIYILSTRWKDTKIDILSITFQLGIYFVITNDSYTIFNFST